MAILLYILASAILIAAVGFVLHRSGFSRLTDLAADDARDLAQNAFPDATIVAAHGAGGVCLFRLDGGGMIVVRNMGADRLVRRYAPQDVDRLDIKTDKVLLRVRDFGDPVVAIRTDDPADAAAFVAEALGIDVPAD